MSTNNLADCSREREIMINTEMAMTLTYGLYTVIFCQAMSRGFQLLKGGNTQQDIHSARRSKVNTNPAFFIAAIIMYALITAVVVIQWRTVADVVGPHGGNGQFLCDSAAAASIPIFLETVYRTYVVYGKTKKIVIVPALFTIAAAAFVIVVAVRLSFNMKGNRTALYDVVFGASALGVITWAYIAMSVFTTLYCSIAITARILHVRRLTGEPYGYSDALEMVAESSLLYTAVLLVTFILKFISARWGSRVAEGILLSVTGLCPTWILSRVLAGSSRPDESWTLDSDDTLAQERMSFNVNHNEDMAAYSPVHTRTAF
ncbi:hypothetical protein CYLTODRAFT_453518 [Cylindrobasidium torrendii FP15055 ss-10]|uniref:Uncharacterized protein n=1 Tax=Cylindrobasidium torrendii FP15055 ss-10 TaxID=1314674 RepID=A0A0D7BD87_9AGAR|nr:hypothetical protein CYLTODRAFT_453518 [Cylindrobasidium torrendii FP15055 ss-10]